MNKHIDDDGPVLPSGNQMHWLQGRVTLEVRGLHPQEHGSGHCVSPSLVLCEEQTAVDEG